MVDEYLTDREQEEALRNWWRENWSWVFGGIVLGLGLLGGWQYWKHHTQSQAAAAAAVYEELRGALERNELDDANRSLGTLVDDYDNSPYAQLGRMLIAKKHVDDGKFEEAVPLLQSVARDSKDAELAWVARLRVARLLVQQGKYDEALKLLNPEKAGAFAAQVREIRGDALVAKGDTDAARAEYAAALADNIDGSPDRMANRAMLEMKLQDVGGDKRVPASATEAAPAEGQP